MGKAEAEQEIDTKTEKTWRTQIASTCAFLKRKGWYTLLLTVSSIYVYHCRYDISSFSLNPLSAQSLVFILWLLLLFWPLISEMEFLGVKVKKEVEKSIKEVKETTKEVKDDLMW